MLALPPQLKSSWQPIQQQVTMAFHYSVHFTCDLLAPGNSLLADVVNANPIRFGATVQPVLRVQGSSQFPAKLIAVIDAGLLDHNPHLWAQLTDYADLYSNALQFVGNPIVVPGGEAAKNDSRWLHRIHEAIDQNGLCRHSYVLAIGGGAVLDLAGYAAATAHRGIRLIRVPTTVLAQNDAGVGVKNAINAFGKKNFLGAFAPPYAVINDFNILTTLSDRDWRAGTAEAVKVALIKDADFFNFLRTHATRLAQRDLETMQYVIYRCAQLHLEHIATSGDAFESGSSRPLDFGHWIAHKLEYLTNYRLRHGEAVAIGIALDSTYSYLQGWLDQSDWQHILTILSQLGFSLSVPELAKAIDSLEHFRSLFQGLDEFREHLGGQLTVMFLSAIGKGIEVHAVDFTLYRQAIVKLIAFEQLL
jgi:3-dehydroquinate synthase